MVRWLWDKCTGKGKNKWECNRRCPWSWCEHLSDATLLCSFHGKADAAIVDEEEMGEVRQDGAVDGDAPLDAPLLPDASASQYAQTKRSSSKCAPLLPNAPAGQDVQAKRSDNKWHPNFLDKRKSRQQNQSTVIVDTIAGDDDLAFAGESAKSKEVDVALERWKGRTCKQNA